MFHCETKCGASCGCSTAESCAKDYKLTGKNADSVQMQAVILYMFDLIDEKHWTAEKANSEAVCREKKLSPTISSASNCAVKSSRYFKEWNSSWYAAALVQNRESYTVTVTVKAQGSSGKWYRASHELCGGCQSEMHFQLGYGFGDVKDGTFRISCD